MAQDAVEYPDWVEEEFATRDVELRDYIVERAQENHEDYGFATANEFIAYAIKYLLEEDPEASEEHLEELIESRRQVLTGNTYTSDEVREEILED